MITKFEKRVIAVILAAVMSLPVTAFSSVTVKAEQADAASGGEVQTSNEALPDADAAAEDFAEGQTPVPDAGGEASDDAAEDAAGMDVPDDGAFIPLEEEKKEVDSADAGSDSQTVPAQETQENSETVRSAKRSAYSDAGREEILRKMAIRCA